MGVLLACSFCSYCWCTCVEMAYTKEHDGVLPLSVEYRVFQQMFSTLHNGIQAGLSDVVSEAFAKEILPPYTKSVADNACMGEPFRASTLLNSILQRTKTCPATFTLFAEALESITSFQYLATDMRNKFTALQEQEAEREREFQKEAKKQELKRQELQLRIVQKPKRSEPVHVAVVAPDSHVSPSVSTMRRIDIPCPQSPMPHDSIMKFNRQNLTPGLDPNTSMTAKTVRLTPDTTRPELGYVVAVAVESPGRAVITGKKIAAYSTAAYPIATRTDIKTGMMPAPSQSHSYSDNQLVPLISSSAQSKILTSDVAIPRHPTTLYAKPPLSHETYTKQDASEVPTASIIPPTPSSPELSTDARIQQQTESDDGASGLNLPHIESMRSMSTDSSVSSCSHDSLESDCEVDSEEVAQKLTIATQESDSTHDNERLVGTSAKKLHRSVSCEKCLKKLLRKKEKKINDMEIEASCLQLDYNRLQAAYESKTEKLLKESSALQNEVYELNISLRQYGNEINESYQRSSDLLATNAAHEDENCRLKEELKEVKADAYDTNVALRNEKSKYHRCPTCKGVFTYRYN